MACKDINQIKTIITGMVLTVIQLEEYETGENADYTGVIDELRWNQMVLDERLKSLKGGQ